MALLSRIILGENVKMHEDSISDRKIEPFHGGRMLLRDNEQHSKENIEEEEGGE